MAWGIVQNDQRRPHCRGALDCRMRRAVHRETIATAILRGSRTFERRHAVRGIELRQHFVPRPEGRGIAIGPPRAPRSDERLVTSLGETFLDEAGLTDSRITHDGNQGSSPVAGGVAGSP
jgi:hypothetical protein